MAVQNARHCAVQATGVLPFPVPDIPVEAAVLYQEFWQLWSEEKFFACHEVLEVLWRETTGPQRLFYNGLIHCAVAMYQHRRGNAVGAARQLVRAGVKLQAFRPRHFEVDVDALLTGVERAIAPSLSTLDEKQRTHLAALEQSLRRRFAGNI
jgi:predicted metal-dependent hydrolase